MTSKKCTKCHIKKKITEFYKDKSSTDICRPECKKCHILETLTRLDDPKRRKKYNALRREYEKRPDVRKRNKIRNSGTVETIKRNARAIVNSAVLAGLLFKRTCEARNCKIKKVHGHHDDYKKPLSVIWYCSKHHGAWHRKNKAKY